jgi:ArsR family transcriptional regulator, arsenate/arsenite/antimonite-responsive transcriptional repressor / arsenate reductase (thioredoxin)
MRSDETAGREPAESTLEQLKLIADETRWRLLAALRYSDCQVGELVEQTGYAQNLVSYHLGILRQAGLVSVHRSDADARANYYGVNREALTALYGQIGVALAIPAGFAGQELPQRTVVFLCRANSARSQMAEGWLRALSGGRVITRSAGTQPARLHPLAVAVMAEVGIDIGHHSAKHVDALVGLLPDVVVTVCDIAREQCAVWLQAATRLHWSIADPAAVEEPARLVAFRAVRDELQQRIRGLLGLLVALPTPNPPAAL